jgi:hypothetical protein
MAGGRFFIRVVVNVEMLGLENAEIKLIVSDLVSAEVLRVGGLRNSQHRK